MDNNNHNQDSRYFDKPGSAMAHGKRLRVEGGKRTEEECRQMLRLAEVENKELKDSLRYVEIQLAKSRDAYQQVCRKYEDATEEIQKCHEQIARQTNINHAQAQQIEEMNRKMDEFVASQKDMYEKSKFKVSTYQNEIDIREEEINRLKRTLMNRDEEIGMLTAKTEQMAERMADIEEELELKSGENNRLRAQVADQEKTVADLYVSRKGEGSFEVEMDKLKADNERLIKLLRTTNEYQELTDNDIMKKATLLSSGLLGGKGNRGKSADGLNRGGASGSLHGPNLQNEWIPTEAVRAIQKIKETFNGSMTETCISQILYELNGIWRAIMRKEVDAIKRRYTQQVQDLRRQLVTKRAFDEEEAHKEITRLKKELQFLQRNGAKKGKNGSVTGSDQQQTKENNAANAFKRPEAQKSETLELKNKISQLERQRLNHNANVIGPLSAMSQSDMDYSASQRYGGGMMRGQTPNNNDDIGPGFFGKFGAGGSGANTVIGGGHEVDRDNDVSHSYSYSDFA